MTTGIQTEVSRLTAAKGAIAQAIEAKGVTVPSGTKLDGMATLIEGIEQGSDPVLQSKTVTPATSAQTVSPDSGYDGLSSVTVNAMPTATQATPSITVSSAGLITASATQSAGYVTAGAKSATKQLTTQAAKTVTPSTSAQTAVASGRYTTGAVTVAGDSNLAGDNIKSGVSIFGVAGTYEGSGGGSGGGVGTCTVIVSNSPADILYQPELGSYETWWAEGPGEIATLECVCGSLIYGPHYSGTGVNATHTSRTSVWLITAGPGETATIS